jgi:hypothetical protein
LIAGGAFAQGSDDFVHGGGVKFSKWFTSGQFSERSDQGKADSRDALTEKKHFSDSRVRVKDQAVVGQDNFHSCNYCGKVVGQDA